MSEPLITTILPTYQRSRHLQRAIRSIQRQTFPDIRICVYDNASKDETEAVVRKMAEKDSRIEYYRHPENIGGSNNYIFAAKRVKTPFFSFFADDDVLLPEFYETAYQALLDNPKAGFFTGLVLTCTEEGKVVKVPHENWPHEELYDPQESFAYMMKHFINWTGMLFRREVLESVKLSADGIIDSDFLMDASAKFPLVLSKKPCAIFLSQSNSDTGRGFNMVSTKIMNRSINKIAQMSALASETKEDVFDHFKRSENSNWNEGLKCALKKRNFEVFDQILLEATSLSLKKRCHYLLRRFVAKNLSFLLIPWGHFKKMRKVIKRRLLKCPPTTLERLASRYGEYSKWLAFEEKI